MAKISTMRLGTKGPEVEKWENFLRGRGLLDDKEVDQLYNEATKEATWAFQEQHGLYVDGWAGNGTIGYAIKQLGLEWEEPEAEDVPPQPADAKPLKFMDRQRLLGAIYYKHAPTASNPEAVKFTNDWASRHLATVEIPQLKGVRGAPSSCKVTFHKKGAEQLKSMFQAWEDAGLSDRVMTWGGSYSPRFIRGSHTTLSNHAHASAFDINVPWNGLGVTPPAVGQQGSVRELVEIAYQHGFFWGGWFSRRRDGMHFELFDPRG